MQTHVLQKHWIQEAFRRRAPKTASGVSIPLLEIGIDTRTMVPTNGQSSGKPSIIVGQTDSEDSHKICVQYACDVTFVSDSNLSFTNINMKQNKYFKKFPSQMFTAY